MNTPDLKKAFAKSLTWGERARERGFNARGTVLAMAVFGLIAKNKISPLAGLLAAASVFGLGMLAHKSARKRDMAHVEQLWEERVVAPYDEYQHLKALRGKLSSVMGNAGPDDLESYRTQLDLDIQNFEKKHLAMMKFHPDLPHERAASRRRIWTPRPGTA